jgi:hypothetical protein
MVVARMMVVPVMNRGIKKRRLKYSVLYDWFAIF